MKGWIALGSAGVVCAALAAAAADWSEDMRRLLPEGDFVTVTLRDGRIWTGRIEAETPENLTLQIETGTVAYQRTLETADVVKRQAADQSPLLAERLLSFDEERVHGWNAGAYRRLISLFDEWLEKAGPQTARPAMEARRAEWAADLEHVEQGMERVDGRWMDPIQAAAWRYLQVEQRMAALEERFRDIAADTFSGPPRAREVYLELERQRREAAHALPAVAAQRVSDLVERAQIDAAIEETVQFMRFWLRRIRERERRPAQRGRRAPRDEIESMDLGFFVRLQQQIIAGYLARKTPAPGDDIPGEEGMVYIPGGYFLMGNEHGQPGDIDYPPHIVHLDGFLIDRHEVTNAEYRRFVEYVQQTGDYSMAHPEAPPLKNHTPAGWTFPELSADDQPVVGVDWFDAYAYARWAGKRLPTEAEWERAARGNASRRYPWGDAPPAERLVSSPSGRRFAERKIPAPAPAPDRPAARPGRFLSRGAESEETAADRPHRTLPAAPWPAHRLAPAAVPDPSTDLADISPFGVLHMGGNAAEWVHDRFAADTYSVSRIRAPAGPDQGAERVFRGGSYLDEDAALTAFQRRHSGQESSFRRGVTARGQPFIGFRCARSLPAPGP